MNEMNNGENDYNNQNQGFNNVNYENSYNQNMNYQNNNQKEVPKKSYCPLLIVFIVISLLLTGFIVYDKAIKKDEKPEEEKIVPEEKKYDDSIDKTIDGKNAKIGFNYLVKSDATDIDIYLNDIRLLTIPVIKKDTADSLCMPSETAGNCAEVARNIVKQMKDSSFGVIKGDKEYLYLAYPKLHKLYIFNTSGKLIYDEEFNYNIDYEFKITDSTCLNYGKYADYTTYYIDKDAIYYIEKHDIDVIIQKKIVVNNDQAEILEASICSGITEMP